MKELLEAIFVILVVVFGLPFIIWLALRFCPEPPGKSVEVDEDGLPGNPWGE